MEKQLDKDIQECNGFLYKQSSAASNVARVIVCAIVGVIWAMSFQNGSFTMPTGCFFVSLLVSVLFFIIDILHYAIDSYAYHRQTIKLENAKKSSDYSHGQYEKSMTNQSFISFGFLIVKCVMCMIAGISLLIGICI